VSSIPSDFFQPMPHMRPLYETLVSRIFQRIDQLTIDEQHGQIIFRKKRNFASVSLPSLRIEGRPEQYIAISFVLNHRIEHPHIAEAAEPYPQRWSHQVIIASPEDIDEQLLAWIEEACAFAQR